MAQASQIIRYSVAKHTFEVLAKPGMPLKFRKDLCGYDKVLLTDDVFTNAKKGQRASRADLEKAFGTSVEADCARIIVEKGDIQLTTAERKEAATQRYAALVNHFHKNYIDPKTKLPHPVTRIESALEALKVHAQPEVPLQRQIDAVAKKLPDVLPVKQSLLQGTLFIPHSLLGKAFTPVGALVQRGAESYDGVGCTMEVTFSPGNYEELLRVIERVGRGDITFNQH